MSRTSSGFARAVTEREIETARTVCGICSGTCPYGWDQANANVLTDDDNMDPVTGLPADRALLARIVKKACGEALA